MNPNNFILKPGEIILDDKSQDYSAFWKDQINKCKNGFEIGGIHIPGRLYFYVNFWMIEVDVKSGKSSFKKVGKPDFRDVEWEFFNVVDQCEKDQQGLIFVSARGAGKSFLSSSIIGHQYTFFSNSESVVSSEEGKHISVLCQKIDLGLSNLPNPLQKTRVRNDWKEAVIAGWKDKKTGLTKGSRSRIFMRNYKNNSMAANGTRPKIHIMEEIGTMQYLKKDYNDSIHCWRNDYGQFSIPILIGTGGDMDKGGDAAEMFYEPEAYNLKSFVDEWETGGQIGFFIPATKAKNQFKDEKPLNEFLSTDVFDKDCKILVSDETKAKEYFEEIRNVKKKSTDLSTLIKEMMYNPYKPSEAFIRNSGSRFNVEQAKQWLHVLETKYKDVGIPVELYVNPVSGKVVSRPSDKKPIIDFPLKRDAPKEGTIIIYEYPIENPPYGQYISGLDPYDQNDAEYSSSLGSCYIYKRFTGLNGQGGTRQIVAEYTGRPQLASQYYENVRLLLLYYNARCLVENQNVGIITHFYNKHYDYLLAETPDLIRNIMPDTKVNRSKGVHAVTTIINHGLNLIKEYCEEEIEKEFNENGELVKTRLGIERIKSIPLLKEIIAYNDEDAKGNYDRIVAFYCLLMYEEELMSRVTKEEQEQHDPISFFANTNNLFKKRQQKKLYGW